MLINDHAATPAAASSTFGAPKLPGTPSANAAATGTSAVTASDVASTADRLRTASAAITVASAIPLTMNCPSRSPVITRWATESPVPTRISPTSASAAPRAMCVGPHCRRRASEKMTAASAMSSTIRGAGGPDGTACSASRSPSTTPTVSSVASRLNGAPPIGARLSRTGFGAAAESAAPSLSWAGCTMRWTAGRISRSGNSDGRAISVSRPPSSPAASTATRTIGITVFSDIPMLSGFFSGELVLGGLPRLRRSRG